VTSLDFTLTNLVRILTDAGFQIVASGDDASPEMTAALAFCGHPCSTRFFARVEGQGDLLGFSTSIMETVWASFERGLMDFRGWCDGEKVFVVVTELEPKA
jgi:hypothetical protein